MRTADKQIADILTRYGEPFGGNIWRVQGTAVIYHKALERIAAQAGIIFDPPTIVRAERDEAAIVVTGRLLDEHGKLLRTEWSIGEAVINVNYRVSGKQAAYVYAMAEKRGKDRVILKLIELHGLVYSEEEADEFRGGSLAAVRPAENDSDEDGATDDQIDTANHVRQGISEAKTVRDVTTYMLDPETQGHLASLTPLLRDAVRAAAKARMVTLGWVKGRAA